MKKFLTKISCLVLTASFLFMGACLSFSEKPIAYASEEIYYGDTPQTRGIGTVIEYDEITSYARKVVTEKTLVAPYYSVTTAGGMDCTPTAGMNAIMYYDRYRGSLVPGYTPTEVINGVTKYKTMGSTTIAKIQNVAEDLYIRMQSSSLGTTYENSRNGLTAFITNAGYTATISNIDAFANNNANIIASINGSKPVMLYARRYRYINFVEEGQTRIIYKVTAAHMPHTMTAFGYKRIDYYNSSDALFRSDFFLKVATGNEDREEAYFVLDEQVVVADSIYIS